MPQLKTEEWQALIDTLTTTQTVFEAAANALEDALREQAGELDPKAKTALTSISDLDKPWGPTSRLQSRLDSLRLTTMRENYPMVLTDDIDVVVDGCFDDESGYEPDLLTLGPIKFNSSGEFAWVRDAVISLMESDAEAFKSFLAGPFGVTEDGWYATIEGFEGTVAHTLLTAPDSIEEDQKREAIEAICQAHPEPYEALGCQDELSKLFYIIARVFRHCASMKEESETVPLNWIQLRLA